MKSAPRDSGRLHSQTFRDQGCWWLCGVPWSPTWSQALAPRGQMRGERRGRAVSQPQKWLGLCPQGTVAAYRALAPQPLAGKTGNTCTPTLHLSGQEHQYAQPHSQRSSPKCNVPSRTTVKIQRPGCTAGAQSQVQTWEAAESRKAQQFMQQRPQKGGKAILKPWLREG